MAREIVEVSWSQIAGPSGAEDRVQFRERRFYCGHRP